MCPRVLCYHVQEVLCTWHKGAVPNVPPAPMHVARAPGLSTSPAAPEGTPNSAVAKRITRERSRNPSLWISLCSGKMWRGRRGGHGRGSITLPRTRTFAHTAAPHPGSPAGNILISIPRCRMEAEESFLRGHAKSSLYTGHICMGWVGKGKIIKGSL